jgi:hypothetical protein
MAVRINVTAVHACSPAELRAVMSEVLRPACPGPECQPIGDQLELHEHSGWTWFTTSVWGVSAGDLNRGLCQVARPALQFTTSDGERWYLTIHGGTEGQVNFLHEFCYHSHAGDPDQDAAIQAQLDQPVETPSVDPRLAFLEDDPPPGATRPKAPFDLIAEGLNQLGGSIAEEFRESVAQLPYSAALNRYRAWHAEQVCRAFSRAGVPHDPAAVRSVLLWENVTDNEKGHDLGNLPRLLSVLGLGGEWDDWVRQAEAPPPPPSPPESPPAEPVQEIPVTPPDPFGPVINLVETLSLSPVAGELFTVSLADLPLLRFFPEALSIHDTAGVVLTVTLPGGFDHTQLPEPTGDRSGTVEVTSTGFRVGLNNHLWFSHKDLTNQLGVNLAHFLYHLPDGSTLDLAFALEGKPALMQRYRGPVNEGQWQIGETFPPLSREALAGGWELARYAAGEPERHQLRDEAEAEAVVELARRDPNLWDSKVRREGRTVWCKSDIIGHLVKVIFRHRFRASWDVAAHDREAAVLYQQHIDLQQKMRRAGVMAARKRAAPHDEEILLHGKCGLYWRSEFTRLEELEQETRQKFDAALTGLGFSHVGELVAKRQRDIVLRVFVSPDDTSYGLLLAKRTMYLGWQFFSRFADGSILFTALSSAENSRPEMKVYYKTYPGLEPAALYEKHRGGIERFRTRKGAGPVALDAALGRVAGELDRALARQLGIGQRFRIISTPPGEPPVAIRAAWVGCVLPMYATTDDPKISKHQKGVLSGRKEDLAPGFVVRALDAVRELEQRNSQAARWWQEHAPQVMKAGQLFAFAADACELAEED